MLGWIQFLWFSVCTLWFLWLVTSTFNVNTCFGSARYELTHLTDYGVCLPPRTLLILMKRHQLRKLQLLLRVNLHRPPKRSPVDPRKMLHHPPTPRMAPQTTQEGKREAVLLRTLLDALAVAQRGQRKILLMAIWKAGSFRCHSVTPRVKSPKPLEKE